MIKVSATDHDKSFSNHNIDYRITEGNIEEVFAITGTTGEIILMNALDREQETSYKLKVNIPFNLSISYIEMFLMIKMPIFKTKFNCSN